MTVIMTAHQTHQPPSVNTDSAIVATSNTPPPAQNVEVFSIGSVIECTTIHGDIVSGEVIAFDNGARILALKNVTVGHGGKSQYHLLNLAMVQNNVKTIQEATGNPPVIPQIDLEKVNARVKTEIKKKRSLLSEIPVTKEGQRVFGGIRKTFEDIRWDKDRIIVLGVVMVKPPYTVKDVTLMTQGRDGDTRQAHTLNHIKKLVSSMSSNTSGAPNMNRDSGVNARNDVALRAPPDDCQGDSGGGNSESPDFSVQNSSSEPVQCPMQQSSLSCSQQVSSGDNSYSSASSAAAEKTSTSSNGPSPPPSMEDSSTGTIVETDS